MQLCQRRKGTARASAMEGGTYVSAERAVRCRRDAYEVPARAGRRPLRRTASQRSRGGDEQMSRP